MQRPAPRPPDYPDLEDYSDPDLLDFAGMRGESLDEDDSMIAEEAFAELYRRQASPLEKILRKSAKGRKYISIAGPDALRAVRDDTFMRACDKADQYDPCKGGVLTWLVAIAKNLIIDLIRQEEDEHHGVDQEQLAQVMNSAFDADLSELDPERVRLIRDALEHAITEREWELLMPYLEAQALGGGRAPDGAVQQVARELGESANYLRVTKTRAIKKIKEYVRERLPGQVVD